MSPLLDKLTGILSAIATPLVFLAVISGIMGIGDIRAFGKIGKKVLVRMSSSYLIAGLLAIIACMAVIGLPQRVSTSSGTSSFGQVFQLVLDVFPSNLFMPFGQGNDLQVIMIAIFVGIVILILGNKLRVTRDLISEGSDLINMMMKLCCKLLPVIVFCGVANLVINSNTEQLYSIMQMAVIFLSAAIVFIAVMLIRTRVTVKTPFKYILPKQVATLLINLTTSSQVTALPENVKCCKEKFGIDSQLTDFALSLGIVVFMPCGAICFIVAAWDIMALSGMPVTISIAIKIMLVGIVVAIAAPPIPGSALVVFPIMLATCGIPNSMLPLAIIFGTLAGYLLPAFNGFLLQLELLMTAKKLKMVDEKTLQAPYVEKEQKEAEA